MTQIKLPRDPLLMGSRSFKREVDDMGRLDDPDAAELLRMASLLGPRDLAALSHIIRRARQICESEGEETALAVLDQIGAILENRPSDA
jgi:hypothetical protein